MAAINSVARLVHYTGRVQGVGFRYTAAEIARHHPVTGWVKNLSDGRVQVLVEGTPDAVDQFLAAIRARWHRHIADEQTEDRPPTGGHQGFGVTR
jgi:acylphosphatase